MWYDNIKFMIKDIFVMKGYCVDILNNILIWWVPELELLKEIKCGVSLHLEYMYPVTPHLINNAN